MTSTLPHGQCQCGAVRFRLNGEPIETYVCHCRECQKQSSSAFGISVIVQGGDLQLLQGSPKQWARRTDTGGMLDCYFCPECGSRLWHIGNDNPDRVSVKGGTLDTAPDLSEVAHIWTIRRLDGVIIPDGVPTYKKEPPR
ncbi:GFA family protein [Hoeflea sp.]|uniref:GFA family protein n=1 Tax=Hoeflea sp. TaxID=1940281 RepID=UPI003B01C95E